MSVQTFHNLKNKNDQLLIAALNVAVLLAPYGTPIPETLAVDADGNLPEFPEGWFSVGEIEKKAGVDLAPDMKTEGIEGYGSPGTRRDFVSEQSFDIDLTIQELRLTALEAYYGLNAESTYSPAGGYFAKQARSSRLPEYSMILIGFDGTPGAEVFPYWIYPRVVISKKGKQSLSETNVLTCPVTFSAKLDPDYGALFGFGITGRGFTPELALEMGIAAADDTLGDGKAYAYNLKKAKAGTYTLSVAGAKTAELAFNAPASLVEAELRKLAGQQTAVVTAAAGGQLRLHGLSAAPTLDAAALTGATDATVTELA